MMSLLSDHFIFIVSIILIHIAALAHFSFSSTNLCFDSVFKVLYQLLILLFALNFGFGLAVALLVCLPAYSPFRIKNLMSAYMCLAF
jgi:hypothetical protein